MTLTIDSYDISGLGFILKDFDSFITIDERKNTAGDNDVYSSTNPYSYSSKKVSPEAGVSFYGEFESISDFEDAIYGLYGKLVSVDEKTFQVSGNSKSLSLKGIVNKGVKIDKYHYGTSIIMVGSFKILKSND